MVILYNAATFATFYNSSAPSPRPSLGTYTPPPSPADTHDNAKSFDKHVSVSSIFFSSWSVVTLEQLDRLCNLCSELFQMTNVHLHYSYVIYNSNADYVVSN